MTVQGQAEGRVVFIGKTLVAGRKGLGGTAALFPLGGHTWRLSQ